MMLSAVAAWLIPVVVTVGAPLVVVLFYAEGLAVGKVLQPPAVFVAYVAMTSPSRPALAIVSAVCVLAATLGQWTLYRGFNDEAPEFFGLRRRVPYLDDVPGRVQETVGERRLQVVERAFDRYGGVGICLTNALPGVRGLTAVPAGLSTYPRGRFIVASTVGNGVYVALLVAVALGIVELAGLVS